MSLPVGTITFLFTDIEGSTRLLVDLGDAYADLLGAYLDLLRRTLGEHGGQEVDTQGDALFTVFPSARDAVCAAVAAQRALATRPWPGGIAPAVRMGLHTGEARLTATGYVGLDVHRAARIGAAVCGGQIVLSQTTRDIVIGALPKGVSLRDLGDHRLKDLTRPQRLFQVVAPDLRTDFPPLRTLDAVPHNLPIQLTSFIGREREMAEVTKLLSRARLVTLTGVGGSGKTRLALQLAAAALEEFADGVWLVELANLTDETLLPHTVASSLGLQEEPGRPILNTVIDYLRSRRMLLLLDNCEHLISSCGRLADALLRQCPNLAVLATSREGLAIAGEHLHPVPPLSLPAEGPRAPADVEQSHAVQLFLERARALAPGFQLDDRTAAPVAQICHRLDGMPLAIELAAARVTALSVEEIAARLHDRFRLLTGGSRAALPRHQTLQAALDWSHALLSRKERVLLRRLAVFAGGWTLEAAEAICAGDGVSQRDVLDLLTALVRKSLVVAEAQDGRTRYHFLETVRQYGLEKLARTQEAPVVRNRHLDWYMRLARSLMWQVMSFASGLETQRQLEEEHDNCGAALEWSLDSGEIELGMGLAAALGPFWDYRGYWSEGRTWLDRVLEAGRDLATPARVTALSGAALLAWRAGDPQPLHTRAQEAYALAQKIGDRPGLAMALLSMVQDGVQRRDYASAKVHAERGAAVAREVGDQSHLGYHLVNLASLIWEETGDLGASVSLHQQALDAFQRDGNRIGVATATSALGTLAHLDGDYGRALRLHEAALAMHREGAPAGVPTAHVLVQLGVLACQQGLYDRARSLLDEALEIYQRLGAKQNIAHVLVHTAREAWDRGDFDQADRQLRESLALRQEIGLRRVAQRTLAMLGALARYRGEVAEAAALLEENLAAFKEAGDHSGVAAFLSDLALVARDRGDNRRAASVLHDGVMSYAKWLGKLGVVRCLEVIATLAAAYGQTAMAARLLAATSARREAMGTPVPPCDRPDYERAMSAVREALGEEVFAAWDAGRTMTLEQTVEAALGVLSDLLT